MTFDLHSTILDFATSKRGSSANREMEKKQNMFFIRDVLLIVQGHRMVIKKEIFCCIGFIFNFEKWQKVLNIINQNDSK
jgi:hypothetical protein